MNQERFFVKVPADQVVKYSLRELRARKHVTQGKVAEYIGVSETTYRNWERRTGIIPLAKADALADYFGVGVGQLKY